MSWPGAHPLHHLLQTNCPGYLIGVLPRGPDNFLASVCIFLEQRGLLARWPVPCKFSWSCDYFSHSTDRSFLKTICNLLFEVSLSAEKERYQHDIHLTSHFSVTSLTCTSSPCSMHPVGVGDRSLRDSPLSTRCTNYCSKSIPKLLFPKEMGAGCFVIWVFWIFFLNALFRKGPSCVFPSFTPLDDLFLTWV